VAGKVFWASENTPSVKRISDRNKEIKIIGITGGKTVQKLQLKAGRFFSFLGQIFLFFTNCNFFGDLISL